MNVDDVGFAAGSVWQFLKENGPASVSKVTESVEGGRTLVLMALGWLAREGKVEFYPEGRAQFVRLRE